MLNDYVVSLIRTVVPVFVATVLARVAVEYGIVLDEETSAQVVVGVVGVVTAVYYAAVRALEQRFPSFGTLLGHRKQPTYGVGRSESEN